ncbi:BASS family bile acid:Na+ symporter [Humitalea rosea]|uniref:BASS family bile acid:Na+ symporter n=1 Tax=Humitalea rosea TaxID=990373 RepID=A0A2W7I3T8_9PROT|nr:hypothetical protein [Humitalea rosea]PZW41334.1 BASS family bile acid:Na+ symporter [Humitalea rosea]
MAALLVVGIGLPPLGAVLRPYVTEAVFLLLVVSFARVDLVALRGHLRRPGLVLAAIGWTTIAVPLLYGVGLALMGAPPGLALGLMLHGIASPMMAAPALAALMGLDATLVLISLVGGTMLVPLTAPLFAWIFLGDALPLSPLAMGLKLAAMLLGSLALALAVRRWPGVPALERHREAVNGFNILVLLVFVSAVMGDVAGQTLADPLGVAWMALLALAIFLVLFGATALLFRRAGRQAALSLALMASQRNMGLMLAATDGALPGAAWLYFAMCQFPIYLAPLLLRRLVRAGIRRDAPGSSAPAGSGSAKPPAPP